MMPMPAVGKTAPAFALPDQDGATVRLADFKDKKHVVLYFYPKALTPGCTVQACGMRDTREDFRRLKTEVLGVSPDPCARLGKFIEKHALNFSLLADEERALAKKYGVWGQKKFMGRTYLGVKRTTFIIDRRGILRHVMEKVRTKTHHEDVLLWIEENL